MLHICFIFWQAFRIHRLSSLSLTRCSLLNCWTSAKAMPVRQQKAKTSRTCSSCLISKSLSISLSSSSFGEKFHVNFINSEMDTIERGLFYPFVSPCDTYHFFQVLQVFQRGIVLTPYGSFQPILEITDELPVQFIQEEIILMITEMDKLSQPVYGGFKFCYS